MYRAKYSIFKNLRLPETGINFKICTLLKNEGLAYLPNYNDHNDSTNKELLLKYDKCDVTRGNISFIPLDFLRSYFKKNMYNVDISTFDNLLDEKKYYVDLLQLNGNFTSYFFENEKYMGIPLEYFRKPVLRADLSKTVDFARIENENPDSIENEIFPISLIKKETIKENKDEWLSVKELKSFITPFIMSLDFEKRELVHFITYLYFPPEDMQTYERISHMIRKENVPESKRFIISIILFESHFSCVIIDRGLPIRDINKKCAFFFDSVGYNPLNLRYDKNFWLLDSSFEFTNIKNVFNPNQEFIRRDRSLLYFCDVLHEEFKITNFFFNTFKMQQMRAECGMFSSTFLLLFLNFLKKRNVDSLLLKDYKFLYFNAISIGGDLIYSLFRGLYFFTYEDIEKNDLNRERNYLNSPYVYEIKNRKFLEYKKISIKNSF